MLPSLRVWLTAACLLACVMLPAQQPAADKPAEKQIIDPQALVGEWRVDLRTAPNAAEYYVTFTVSAVEENTFQGRFYNSTVQEARMNKAWGTLHFAFLTNDGNGGRYHTTGRLLNGKLKGTTHAVDRKFLSYWTAEKVK